MSIPYLVIGVIKFGVKGVYILHLLLWEEHIPTPLLISVCIIVKGLIHETCDTQKSLFTCDDKSHPSLPSRETWEEEYDLRKLGLLPLFSPSAELTRIEGLEGEFGEFSRSSVMSPIHRYLSFHIPYRFSSSGVYKRNQRGIKRSKERQRERREVSRKREGRKKRRRWRKEKREGRKRKRGYFPRTPLEVDQP